jgi:hypothetical protein
MNAPTPPQYGGYDPNASQTPQDAKARAKAEKAYRPFLLVGDRPLQLLLRCQLRPGADRGPVTRLAGLSVGCGTIGRDRSSSAIKAPSFCSQ